MILALGLGFDPGNILHNIVHGALYFLPVFLVTNMAGGFWEALFAITRKHEINEGFLGDRIALPPDPAPHHSPLAGGHRHNLWSGHWKRNFWRHGEKLPQPRPHRQGLSLLCLPCGNLWRCGLGGRGWLQWSHRFVSSRYGRTLWDNSLLSRCLSRFHARLHGRNLHLGLPAGSGMFDRHGHRLLADHALPDPHRPGHGRVAQLPCRLRHQPPLCSPPPLASWYWEGSPLEPSLWRRIRSPLP